MVGREGEPSSTSGSGDAPEQRKGRTRKALPEKYARLDLASLSSEELLRIRQELHESGDWRKGGGKNLLDRIDRRLIDAEKESAATAPESQGTPETTETTIAETTPETVDAEEEAEATREWLERENPDFHPVPQSQRFEKAVESESTETVHTEPEAPAIENETTVPKEVPEVFAMPAGPSAGTSEATEPVPLKAESEALPVDTEKEDLLRLLEITKERSNFLQRMRHGRELATVQQAARTIEKGEPLADQGDALFASLGALYHKQILENKGFVAADAARAIYRHSLERGKLFPKAEDHAAYLHAISSSGGKEEALRYFHTLRDRAGGMQQEHMGPENAGAANFVDVVGETWFAKIKEEVAETEQRKRRVQVPPAVLGRFQRIIESDPIPETLDDRVRAAAEYIDMLRGWRPVEVPSETPEFEPTPTSLGLSRLAYAKALQSQSRVFGRASAEQLEQMRTEYQSAIEAEVQTKVHEIAASLERSPDGQPVSPDAEAAAQAAIVELVLSSRFEEETALRESLRGSAEKTAASRFKHFWHQHAKARIAVGLLLTGATIGSAASGNVLAAGILQSMRSALSGTSAAMTTEAIWEQSREAWGATKNLTAESVTKLSDAELERRLAAHAVAAAGVERGVYERKRGRTETVALIQAEYRRRKAEALQNEIAAMKTAGRSTSEMTEALLLHSMEDELGLHKSYEQQQENNRKNAIRKWIVSGSTGLIVAGITQSIGAGRIARTAEATMAKESGEHAATHGGAVMESGGIGNLHTTAASSAAHVEVSHDVLAPGIASEHAANAAHETVAPASAELYEGQLKDAVIHKGEGIEHALRRQLEAAPEKFGFHGDAADKASIHAWSGGEAHRIAIREGFVTSDGHETQVLFDPQHPAQFALNSEGHVHAADAHTYAAVTPTHGAELHADLPSEPGLRPELHIRPLGDGALSADAPVTESPDGLGHAVAEHVSEKLGETPIVLSDKGREALSAFREFGHTLGKTDAETFSSIKKAVFARPANEALNRKLMEQFIDRQAGGDHETAETYAKSLEKLFKAIPKDAVQRNETIGSVMNRMASALDRNPLKTA